MNLRTPSLSQVREKEKTHEETQHGSTKVGEKREGEEVL